MTLRTRPTAGSDFSEQSHSPRSPSSSRLSWSFQEFARMLAFLGSRLSCNDRVYRDTDGTLRCAEWPGISLAETSQSKSQSINSTLSHSFQILSLLENIVLTVDSMAKASCWDIRRTSTISRSKCLADLADFDRVEANSVSCARRIRYANSLAAVFNSLKFKKAYSGISFLAQVRHRISRSNNTNY
jgi:hypothetical protein